MKIFRKLFVITALFFVSILLVSCNKDEKVPKSLRGAYDKLDYNLILSDNESKDKVTSKLNLLTSLDEVSLFWASDKTSVVNEEGIVKRQAQDEVVVLSVSLTKDNDTTTKEFTVTVLAAEPIGSEDVDGTITYEFDFTTLEDSFSYVKEETDTIVKNKKDNSDFTFLRYYTNISKSSGTDARGLVIGMRAKDGNPNPHVRTSVAINNLVGVEFSFTNWVSDLYHNLEAHTEGVYLEISDDGTDWTTVKDIKADIDKEKNAVNSFKLSIDNPDNKAYYVRLRVVATGTLSGTYSMRLILTNMSFYTK